MAETKMTISKALLEYFDMFELIERYGEDKYVSLNWIDSGIIFGIASNPDPLGGVIRKDVVGNVYKGSTFMFNAYFEYTPAKLAMIENDEFFQELMYWVQKNNKDNVVPSFGEADGRRAISIDVVQTPFLFDVDQDNQHAQYTVTFRLNYKEKRI